MRLFLDANVLFTAAHREAGKASYLIGRSGATTWETVTCALAVEEAARNLKLKFPSCSQRFESLLVAIRLVETVVEEPCPLPLPQKDRPILLSALRSDCTHLLTGDRRLFGRYMNRPSGSAGLTIQTVAGFLDEIARL